MAFDDPKSWDAYTADMLRLNELMRANAALLAACEAALERLQALEQTYLINRGHPNNSPEIEKLEIAIKLAREVDDGR